MGQLHTANTKHLLINCLIDEVLSTMSYIKQIDIIIPCFNESKYLPITLSALTNMTKELNLKTNIFVIDNGSTDNSSQIAKKFGARVMVHNGVSIGKLRNIGAYSSSGDFIVFLDADIEITNTWIAALSFFISNTYKKELLIIKKISDI